MLANRSKVSRRRSRRSLSAVLQSASPPANVSRAALHGEHPRNDIRNIPRGACSARRNCCTKEDRRRRLRRRQSAAQRATHASSGLGGSQTTTLASQLHPAVLRHLSISAQSLTAPRSATIARHCFSGNFKPQYTSRVRWRGRGPICSSIALPSAVIPTSR